MVLLGFSVCLLCVKLLHMMMVVNALCISHYDQVWCKIFASTLFEICCSHKKTLIFGVWRSLL